MLRFVFVSIRGRFRVFTMVVISEVAIGALIIIDGLVEVVVGNSRVRAVRTGVEWTTVVLPLGRGTVDMPQYHMFKKRHNAIRLWMLRFPMIMITLFVCVGCRRWCRIGRGSAVCGRFWLGGVCRRLRLSCIV